MAKLASAAPVGGLAQKPLFDNRMLRRLIIPLVIEQTLAVAVGMVDTMMVSSVGEAAVSGVSLVDLITVLIINLFAALATGGAVVISQYIGAKNMQKARDSATQLMLLSALLGGGIALICLVFAPLIMAHLFGALAADVYSAGVLYLQVSAISFPFLALYNAGAAIFRSTGNSQISMRVSLVMNLINVVGNAICIFGLKMGVLGVAIPSVISRVVAAAMIVALCARPANPLAISMPRRVEPFLARRILGIGIPSALENSIFQGGRILVVGMIATYGTLQITANAVACNLTALACMPGNAISLAMIAVVGRCIGAGDTDQAIYNTRKMMLWVFIAGGLAHFTICVTAPLLLGLYTLAAETAVLARTLVLIHSGPAIIIWTFSFVLPNALRAANDARFTMVISIISMCLCRLAIGYLLCIVLGFGAPGVWCAMVIDWVFRSSFFIWRFLSGRWKTKYVADASV